MKVITRVITSTHVVELTDAEMQYLHDYMQNCIFGDETDEQATIREAIFDATTEALKKV